MKKKIFNIVNRNSKFLFIDNDFVNLTITSPYYRNAIDYEKHISGEYYRSKKEYMSIDEYTKNMMIHFKEVYRVTVDGGFCCVIIGNELDNGKLISLPSYFTIMMDKIKWKLQDEIIWYKVTGGKKRFRVTVQHPFSTYYYPNILHEKILIFRKGKKIHRRKKELVMNDVMKKEVANSVWHIPPVPPNANYDHPCPFPEDIPYRLILLYSSEYDFVLDNFNGVGTTTKIGHKLERNVIGYDIVKEYCEIAEKRKNDPLKLRDPIIPKWEKVKENI